MSKPAHRQAFCRMRITGPDGAPLVHREVTVDQVSHRFLFGCGAFDAVAMTRAAEEEQRALARERVEKWLALFNYGTLPFYWGRYEPREGHTAYEETMAAAKTLRAHGAKVKGHPLCWHTVCAPWLLRFSNEEILRRQLARIRREVTAYRGVIDLWDVINEVVIMPDFDRYDNAVTRICRQLGRTELVKEVFAAARESNPDAVLLINDFNTGPAYEHLLQDLLEAEVPIGAIGIQSHQHQGYWGLEKMQRVLERFARFGLPLHFTENTLISGELMPPQIVDLNDWQVAQWPSTPEGEERQAAELKEMMTAAFEHPLVEAFTTWDFADGGWLGAPAGLVRKDNSEKPAYHMLRELIHGEWETHLKTHTDGDGWVSFTGFAGDYTLRCGEVCLSASLDRPANASQTR